MMLSSIVPSITKFQRSSQQRGVGVIEVLVALVVVSFGVLGIAGMQLTGMKHSTNGFNRAKALLLAEDMATRMRINSAGVRAQAYSGFDSRLQASICQAQPDPYCQAVGNTPPDSCSAIELAAFDLFSVTCGDLGGSVGANAGVQGRLPDDARLQIVCNDTPCGDVSTYTVSVSWPEARTVSSNDSLQVKSVQMKLRP